MLEALVKEKENLEGRREELQIQKISNLEDRLAKVKRLYGEMKTHLVRKNNIYGYALNLNFIFYIVT